MAKKKNTTPQRIDAEVWKKMEDAFTLRVKNGLMKPREMKSPEMFKLLGKTQGFNQSLREIITKPKRNTP
ncbi:hypothetical protein HN698_07500 [Candidatus Woesearchaeota archaeon]|jgi:hypothetical protein|nr:hypothetical protein [Candidatus Woesearchaeota archaeon]